MASIRQLIWLVDFTLDVYDSIWSLAIAIKYMCTTIKYTPRPSGEKIAAIADKLDLKKNVVRVWFCNQVRFPP